MRTSSSLAAASDTTETDADDATADADDVPEYVRRASAPSDFEEHSWGDDPKIAETCLRAMRIQWTHGFTSTPKGFARATHGFGEILAGMQPAACEAIFDAFEAPVRSVLDPFMGGGTTLIVGQSLGCRAIGVDVSPLACFVSANRNWRASTDASESTAASARLAMADVSSSSKSEHGEDNDDGDAVVAVPRPWRPVRNALSAYVESERFASEVDESHRDRVVEALWFCLSVALQRTQKSQNKRRPRKGGKRRNNNDGNGGDKNVEVFLKIVDEYVNRVREFQAICDAAPNVAPPAEIYNVDVRKFKLGDDEKVDAVLTSCPYPAVYDYLSFARKVRAGSGAVVKKSTTTSSLSNATSAYTDVVVPGDRNWPKTWMEGEIGSRKALRSNPYEFAAVWQREQEDWLAVVADSLRSGGRAAIMVGDGANIDTRKSIVDAATKFGLLELGGATMKLTATMADGQTVYNQARTEHLIVFQKP